MKLLVIEDDTHTANYIEKGLREASPLFGSDLARFLGTSLVVVEPGRRSIGVLAGSDAPGADRWFEV